MPLNISLGLWTISVMEEAGKGSYGRRAEFLPLLHWQLESGAGWSEELACYACVLSPHVEFCTPWCDNNHHNTQSIINEIVGFRYHRLTCVHQHSPGLSTRPHCSRVNVVFFGSLPLAEDLLCKIHLWILISLSKAYTFPVRLIPSQPLLRSFFFTFLWKECSYSSFEEGKWRCWKMRVKFMKGPKFPNVSLVSQSQILVHYCLKSGTAQTFDIWFFLGTYILLLVILTGTSSLQC